ncbi:MAG: hypothetical protein UU34_C0004G0004 [Candidatus Curtissbacteria bacterium GW2011_GWA1_41_11]|uniref:AB hydrolase-1 domain-containing protein n=1 Tax=Candidatus Curtissbacteria bacterium GW2011_GWA1_41_11 TaxID=1618409 RepID=A0A0G0UEX5_9BACT|nr:MAG: hypothetical protein UU34_C0004G0004 [Candidatus Curtissbacteria bacterium GW2011_GWA1_41_11]
MESVEIKVNGLKLKGAIFYPQIKKTENPAILIIQGWTGHKENSYQYAESLSRLGFICLLFDSRGHGESEGNIKTATMEDFTRDDQQVFDFLASLKSVDPKNISVVGSSFGGYRAAYLTSKRPVKNLLLRVAADYANDTFKIPREKAGGSEIPEIMAWRKKAKNPSETYALSAVNNFKGNVLVIESEFDEFVPHQTTENYKNAVKDKTKLTYVFMKDAPHSIKAGPFRDKVEKIYLDWFKKRLSD